MLIRHPEVKEIYHRFDVLVVVKFSRIFDKVKHPFLAVFVAQKNAG